MRRTLFLFASFVTLTAASGCGSSPESGVPLDTSGNAPFKGAALDAGPDAALPVDAGYAKFPTGGFAISGNVADSVTSAPLPGAVVCLIKTPDACTVTDANGGFTVSGVATTDGFTITLKDYTTGVWPVTPTVAITSYPVVLRKVTDLSALAAAAGTTLSSTNGLLDFEVLDGNGAPLSGATLTTSSQTGTTAFFDGTTLSTTDKSTTALGTGMILNVAPGTVSVGFTASEADAGLTCTAAKSSGWPPGPGATLNVPIVAGQITRAVATCK